MRNFTLSVCLFIALLLVTLSCQKEQEINSIAPIATKITIAEARAWYEQHEMQVSPSAGGRRKLKKEPIWEKATKHLFNNKEVVSSPLKSEEGYVHKGSVSKLLMYKDEQGQMQTRVLRLIGDRQFVVNKGFEREDKNFSGVVQLEDLQGKVLEGQYYRNGQWVASLSSEKTTKGARTHSEDNDGLHVMQIAWYEQVCAFGSCGEWVFTGYTTRYISLPTIGYDYFGTFVYSSGGGGSDGSGDGGYQYCADIATCQAQEAPDPDSQPVTYTMEVVYPANWWRFVNKYGLYDTPCSGYKAMIEAGYADNDPVLSHELGGMIVKALDYNGNPTGPDKFIVFPVTLGDGAVKTTWDDEYNDDKGREILSFWSADKKTFVKTTTYSDLGVPISVMYQANTMVHTHPYDDNGEPLPHTDDKILQPNIPSDPDKNLAANFSWLTHTIVSMDQIFSYNASGAITSSTANNCK